MIISGNIIVKDDTELNSLKDAVGSIIDYVDEICITANGDKVSEIEKYCDTEEKIKYSFLKWDKDFSKQRNFNFSQSRKDTDFHIWIDADDIFVGGEYLRELAQTLKDRNYDQAFLAYWYGCTFDGEPSLETMVSVDVQHYRERLIKPGAITWKKRIHETPVPVEGQRDNYTKIPYDPKKNPIAVLHKAQTGVDQAGIDRMNRNREILEIELEEERAAGQPDPRTILYLMKIYTESEDKDILKKCIEMGHEYLSLSGWDEERGTACDLMSICYSKMGNFADAAKFLHASIEEFPHNPLQHVRLAMTYYNLGDYKKSQHWLDMSGVMDIDDSTAGIKNFKELKVLYAQTMLKLKFNVQKDLKGAVEAAKMLYKEQPIEENKQNLNYILDRNDLYEASEDSKRLFDYLENIEHPDTLRVLDSLPRIINEQPWAISKRQKLTSPRVWKDDEICYFANFGSKHFEKWDSSSLEDGIGGSETAVIKLSQLWADRGYKVTVYGDPKTVGDHNGVTYLPWFHFNPGDKFNVFIQWRNASLAPRVSSKRFLVDLHDVVAQVDHPPEIVNAVDKYLFKSKYHRNMLPDVPDDKVLIVSNGIVV